MNFEISPKIILEPILVSTPVGDSIVAQKVYKKYPVIVLHRVLLADLIELDMVDFNVILGMDWLYSSYASLIVEPEWSSFNFWVHLCLSGLGILCHPKVILSLTSKLESLFSRGVFTIWLESKTLSLRL